MRHVFRLHRGDDLRGGIEKYVREHGVASGAALACVGCVSAWRVRAAGGKAIYEGPGPCEIVSLTGTVSVNGCHLHIALAREDLSAFGGHLTEGCIVDTTAEIVLEELPAVRFSREFDAETGYRELVIERRSGEDPQR